MYFDCTSAGSVAKCSSTWLSSTGTLARFGCVSQLGLHRLLNWPDILPPVVRQICLQDIRLNSNIEVFFPKKTYLYLVFNKCAYKFLL